MRDLRPQGLFPSSLASLLPALFALPLCSSAAELPSHAPLRVVIVSDEVNPHGLPDEVLTQPGELSVALQMPAAGINLESVTEIPTDDIAQATALLQVSPGDPAAVDVLIYFAHRIPNGPDATTDQESFVDAMEAFLVGGGGVVVFHHGSYLLAGKESVQELIGATAFGAVSWNTVEGQNVINVAPGHFVTSHAVEYPAQAVYEDAGLGVPMASYPLFNNTPDERYLNFEINGTAGEIEVLFASDYKENGSTHLLGFTHSQPGWGGIVVAYQPGEN